MSILSIGSKVAFRHGSEPWAFCKNKDKIHSISNIRLSIDDDGRVTRAYASLRGRSGEVLVGDLILAAS